MSETNWGDVEKITIRGLSGYRDGARERAVRDGVHAAARILAARGVDCRGALDFHGDKQVEKDIEEILAHVREYGRETTAVPPPVDTPIPVVDENGERPEDPRMATPEGRLELFKEVAAAGNVEFAPDERGGFCVQWSSERGFGEVAFVMGEDGEIRCDDEMEGRGGVLAILLALIEVAKFNDDEPKEPDHGPLS